MCVCVCVCVYVCVCAFVFTGNRGHEPTHQHQIEDNTATVDCPRLEKWCKRMQMHVDTRVKKNKKKRCRGKSTVSE